MQKTLHSNLISELQEIVGTSYVFTDKEVLLRYASDHTEDFVFPPQVVVKPDTAQEVSAILKLANKHKIAVTPIGALTGLSGGALSVLGGIGLSMERFDRILEIDSDNFQVIVEPGVITQVLQESVAEKGLFYPVDPSSRGSCFIGGNIAENSGGARAVKYGVTKDYVLSLEVVLPTGEIINTGARTLKNATGYNLTQLLVGSEGTLGVITQITLRLLPQNKYDVLMLVPFNHVEQACEAVAEIFKAGISPSALEFMERDALEWTMRFVESPIEVAPETQAHLLIEVDGNYSDILIEQAQEITRILEVYEIGDILFAESKEQKDALWKLRRAVGEAVKSHSVYKEEDTVVPRYELPKLIRGIKQIGDKYGFRSVCYGHAGDGNLHINIIKGDMPDQRWEEDVPKGIRELFELTLALGGTLSGEHGIGFVQKSYMNMAFSPVSLRLMEDIKKLFDPNGILNPGKIFPNA